MSQFYPPSIITTYFLKIYLNVILLPPRFPTKNSTRIPLQPNVASLNCINYEDLRCI